MRAVVQRVSRAGVTPGGEIGRGLCVLLGVARGGWGGGGGAARGQGRAVADLRRTTTGRFDRSVADVGGAVLVVSQFTLIADTAKGNRPSFAEAAPPEGPSRSTKRFCAELRALGVPVETGVFGAKMDVELVNDGPVTIVLDVGPTT